MPSPTQKKGAFAEQRAAMFLRAQGLQYLQCNYQTKCGELDLIMQDGESLVFVEVRFRDETAHGSGIESITAEKRSKIIKAATYYLVEHHLWDKIPCRFDVIGIGNESEDDITWIKDAFGVQ